MQETNLLVHESVQSGGKLAAAVRAHPLVSYFLLAFAGTWLVFGPAVLSRGFGLFPTPDAVVFGLFILSTFTGPLAAAQAVTGLVEGKAGISALLHRIVRFRVGAGWYALVLLGYPALLMVGLLPLAGFGPYRGILQNPAAYLTAFLPAVAMNLLMPALGEEPGWRGFALPRLQKLHGPLLGTLILGSLHALWHLPAYIVPGFFQAGPFNFALFIANSGAIIAATVIWTWLYNHARGSVFFAMLVHATSNATPALVFGWLGPLHPGVWFGLILYGAAAVVLAAVTRGRLGYAGEG